MTTQTQNPAYRPTPPSNLDFRVWAIADTHLGAAVGKTMDRFGERWRGHRQKLMDNAWHVVAPNDYLLLAGDLSWALRRADAEPDLAFLAALPGNKVIIKGNHDYWWPSGNRLDFPGLSVPPLVIGPPESPLLGIAGTRGWQAPQTGDENEAQDERILERERNRLRASLSAIALCPTKIAMLHYPPHPFLPDLRDAGVTVTVYGHLHLGSPPEIEALALDGEILDGIALYCVAADRVDFRPRRIL